MNSKTDCSQAEIIAGAIALGEAGDAERHAYRSHVSTCRRCVNELGGEREIERVIGLVAQARDEERWQPDIRKVVARERRRRGAWRWGAVLAAAAAVVFAARLAPPAGSPVVHSVASLATPAVAQAQASGALASLGTQAVSRHEGRAESLQFAREGAASDAATVRVTVDSHGRPTHCTIVKRSTRASLDAAICNAVMRLP